MTQFVSLSYEENNQRSAIRLDAGGQTQIVVTGPRGEIVESIREMTDPRRASRITLRAASIAANLRSPGGDLTLGVGFSEGQERRFHLTEYDLSYEGLTLVEELRQLCREFRSDELNYRQLHRRDRRGPTDRRATPLRFVTWSFAFVLAFLAAMVLSGAIMLVVTGLFGAWGAGPWMVLGLVLVAGSQAMVGRQHGEHFRAEWDVLVPATVGMLPILLFFAYTGSPGGVVFAGFMPIVARMGANTAF